MQIAKMSALYKKGDRTALSNYRPIAILPIFSKGLEKIIFNRISLFLETKNLLTRCQYAFRKNRSTQLALLDQKEFILNNFEKRLLTLGVFIDFTKAFDCINHELLLKKLLHYGIRGVAFDLIKSYLNSRQQYVEINNIRSQIQSIHTGIPQGSILGPLLFNIYINDVVNIDSSTKYIIYADDTTMLFTSNDAHDLASTANAVLEKLRLWCINNGLKVNTDKTKAMLFQPKNKDLSVSSDIMFSSSKIELVHCAKTLGVLFDHRMSWNDHINFLMSKLSKTVGLMYSVKHLPRSAKVLIYNALFLSHINYCSCVWGTTSATNLHHLFLLQKKCARIISKMPYHSPSEPLFQELSLLKVHNLPNYRLVTAYRKEQKSGTNFIAALANLKANVPAYNTRSPEFWHVPCPRTNYGTQMISCTLPTLLNKLDLSSIDVTSLSAIRTYFL